MKPILEIKGISKKFRIHHEHQPYLSMRDRIAGVFNTKKKKEDEDFWALRDVTFNVERGESIGIIGKNGAGKSTLLKILSKITPPTKGKIVSQGRIASLLEVGTGFHPELSGRENIFLNGSILGMKKKEIRGKFDEIVNFSGVERFLDTPLKHYSSGMQLRLAFAVAAFLEPEILIIDEVLAVGDAEFQKKCMGKMDEVSKSGRTILFVSHNMTAVNSICPKCVHLHNGKLAAFGDTEDVINQYLSSANSTSNNRKWADEANPVGDEVAQLLGARLINTSHQLVEYGEIDKPIGIEYTFRVLRGQMRPVPNIHLLSGNRDYIFVSSTNPPGKFSKAGVYKSIMWIPANLLNQGIYVAGLALSTMSPVTVHFFEKEAMIFEMIEDVNKREADYRSHIPGVIRPSLQWEIEHIDS